MIGTLKVMPRQEDATSNPDAEYFFATQSLLKCTCNNHLVQQLV